MTVQVLIKICATLVVESLHQRAKRYGTLSVSDALPYIRAGMELLADQLLQSHGVPDVEIVFTQQDRDDLELAFFSATHGKIPGGVRLDETDIDRAVESLKAPVARMVRRIVSEQRLNGQRR